MRQSVEHVPVGVKFVDEFVGVGDPFVEIPLFEQGSLHEQRAILSDVGELSLPLLCHIGIVMGRPREELPAGFSPLGHIKE